MDLPSPRMIARWAGAVLLGVVVGVIGTGVHRMARPWGLVLALATVALAGVVGRAWIGWVGVLAAGVGVATAVGILGAQGPGGDVLIAADAWGYTWYAGALAVGVAALLPRAWLDSEPRPPLSQAEQPPASGEQTEPSGDAAR